MIIGAEPQVVAGVGRGDDLAGIHAVLGVEGGLDPAEGAVDLGAEQRLVPEAPGQAVAVLAAHGAAELGDEPGYVPGNRA